MMPGRAGTIGLAALILTAGSALILTAGSAMAEEPLPDPVRDFCIDAESGLAARRACERDWFRAARMITEFGLAKGYVTPDGDLDGGRMLSSFLSWSLLLGQPPDDAYYGCMGANGAIGLPDLRKIWACMVDHDPDAARMDAI